MQGQESAQAARRSAAGDQSWLSKGQQAGSSGAAVSPRGQAASGEASRGRSPVPDPTGAEDSPLCQVTVIPCGMLCTSVQQHAGVDHTCIQQCKQFIVFHLYTLDRTDVSQWQSSLTVICLLPSCMPNTRWHCFNLIMALCKGCCQLMWTAEVPLCLK